MSSITKTTTAGTAKNTKTAKTGAEHNTGRRFFTTYRMALIAVMTAVICVLGPLSFPIPVSPVPITLTNLAIYLTVCILGWRSGTISTLLYLLIGLSGLPVFSSFGSGFGKLLGPTGGYLIGFVPMAVICGLVMEKSGNRLWQFAGFTGATLVLYVFGTAWLAVQAHLTFINALWIGVIPYIPGDLIKIILVLLIAPTIRKRLRQSGLFF